MDCDGLDKHWIELGMASSHKFGAVKSELTGPQEDNVGDVDNCCD